MASANKHTTKRRKKSSFFCSFGGCFGISNKVSAEHGEGKSVKRVTNRYSGRQGTVLPVKIPTSKEILVIKDHEEKKKTQILDPPENHELISHKTHDISSVKSKNKEKSNPVLQTGQTKRVEKQNSIALTCPTTKLSHSVSLPPPSQMREKPGAGGGKTGREVKVAGEIDPMVGAVIIMVTLIVMLIWGKMCAILSTAAWFYFLPRVTARMDNSRPIKLKTGDDRVDLDSWEYKKNVVLRGLLDRK